MSRILFQPNDEIFHSEFSEDIDYIKNWIKKHELTKDCVRLSRNRDTGMIYLHALKELELEF